MSTGHLHLNGFDSASITNNKSTSFEVLLRGIIATGIDLHFLPLFMGRK